MQKCSVHMCARDLFSIPSFSSIHGQTYNPHCNDTICNMSEFSAVAGPFFLLSGRQIIIKNYLPYMQHHCHRTCTHRSRLNHYLYHMGHSMSIQPKLKRDVFRIAPNLVGIGVTTFQEKNWICAVCGFLNIAN